MTEVERRSTKGTVKLRASTSGDSIGELSGLGIVFDTPADIGPFVETIAPEAVDGVFERSDTRSLVNHNPDRIIGRVPKTMSVDVRDGGVYYTVDLPDTVAGRDVKTSVKRGDISGSSFAFSVPEGGDEWDDSGEKPKRRITQFERIHDLSPVTFPAYESTTVSARALRCVGAECRSVGGDCGYRPSVPKRRREFEHRRRQLQAIEARLAAEGPGVTRNRRELPPPGRWGESLRPLLLHEAGHAVSGERLFGRVKAIKVDYRNGRPTGSAATYWSRMPKDARVHLAGPIAERWGEPRLRRLSRKALVEERIDADDQDFKRAKQLCARGKSGDLRYRNRFSAAWKGAQEFLREHWHEVERVADLVAEAPGGLVTGDQIRRVLRKR